MIYFTGTDVAALTALSAYGRTLLDDADAGAARGTLGLGTMSTVNSPVPVANGGTAATDAGTARTNLGLGTMSTQNANAVAITGGSATLGTATVTGNTTLAHTAVGGVFDTVFRLSVQFDRNTAHGMTIKGTGSDTAGTSHVIFKNQAGGDVGNIACTASATAYNTSSDMRLKDAIEDLQGALETVLALRPVSFLWKADGSLGHGLIAQDVQQVVPDVVSGTEDGDQPMSLDYSKLVPWLIGAVQTLAARVAVLEGG
jgi:hypothetical protein